jgi:hypothetical protein
MNRISFPVGHKEIFLFPPSSLPDLTPTKPSAQIWGFLSSVIKLSGCEGNHLLLRNTDDKNAWSSASVSTIVFMLCSLIKITLIASELNTYWLQYAS